MKSTLNIPKLFYRKVVSLMDKLYVYGERTGKYYNCFKRYVDKTKIIIDVGCGSGSFSKALATGRRLVIALDIERELLRKIEGTIEKVCADAHHLPFRESSADCVLSLSLLEHLENPEKFVEELYRVLKCSGTSIIQLPNLQYPFEPHSKWPLLYLFPKKIQSLIFKSLNYTYINMNVTIKYIIKSLTNTGFNLEKSTKVYHLNIMKILPLAPSYIFIFRKLKKA